MFLENVEGRERKNWGMEFLTEDNTGKIVFWTTTGMKEGTAGSSGFSGKATLVSEPMVPQF